VTIACGDAEATMVWAGEREDCLGCMTVHKRGEHIPADAIFQASRVLCLGSTKDMDEYLRAVFDQGVEYGRATK